MGDRVAGSVPVHSTLDLRDLEDEASSANASIVGACILAATLRVPIVSGPRAAELIQCVIAKRSL